MYDLLFVNEMFIFIIDYIGNFWREVSREVMF